jgi:hypothetical protein
LVFEGKVLLAAVAAAAAAAAQHLLLACKVMGLGSDFIT